MDDTVRALNRAKMFIDQVGRARVQIGLGRLAFDIELKALEKMSPTPQTDYMNALTKIQEKDNQ